MASLKQKNLVLNEQNSLANKLHILSDSCISNNPTSEQGRMKAISFNFAYY